GPGAASPGDVALIVALFVRRLPTAPVEVIEVNGPAEAGDETRAGEYAETV
ncbi:MAG: hypothetical protein ITG02_07360, partial [Patulibacter sp.]|nr:hypothetical protein [Patulibacter sp.]